MTAVATEPRLYHLGLAENCPVEEVTAGGVRLHKATAKVSIDRRGNTKRDRRPGQVVPLTEEQHAKLIAAVGRLAIRRRVDQAGNGVAWGVTLVGERMERAGQKVTSVPVKDGAGKVIGEEITRVPQFERRTYDVFSPRTDEWLAPYVFLEPVESDPFSSQPKTRLSAPVQKMDDSTAANAGESASEQPKRRQSRQSAE